MRYVEIRRISPFMRSIKGARFLENAKLAMQKCDAASLNPYFENPLGTASFPVHIDARLR